MVALLRIFVMATFVRCIPKYLYRINLSTLKPLQTLAVSPKNVRHNHMFKHLANSKEHKEQYEYEVSKDPKEWELVEKLMPLETVPVPRAKPNYSSGWRPTLDEHLKHPYFVERTKNHMLPVYLRTYNISGKMTKVKNIHGDIWGMHKELKDHLEQETGKKIASVVNEGSNVFLFRGDFVYYCEQWLLNKGF